MTGRTVHNLKTPKKRSIWLQHVVSSSKMRSTATGRGNRSSLSKEGCVDATRSSVRLSTGMRCQKPIFGLLPPGDR